MKRALLLVVSSLFVSSLALADTTPISPVKPIAPLPSAPMLQCIDPAAVAIDYSLVSKKTAFTGTVRIKGTVKNVGNASYVSGANQQVAQLIELTPGLAPKVVATRAFQNLAAGEQFSFSFDRDWYAAGEFQPSYKLVIVYEPDIRLDGNLKNDDCRMANNALERVGTDINKLFH